jgi:hypothetical protein
MHYLSAVVAATAAFASLSDALTIPNDAKYVLHEKREAHLDNVAKTKRSTYCPSAVVSLSLIFTAATTWSWTSLTRRAPTTESTFPPST